VGACRRVQPSFTHLRQGDGGKAWFPPAMSLGSLVITVDSKKYVPQVYFNYRYQDIVFLL